MTTRSLLIRSTLAAAFSLLFSAPEKADANWYGGYGYQPYYAGYSPYYNTGWGYRPFLAWRINAIERREARLAYRQQRLGYRGYGYTSYYGGGDYYGSNYGYTVGYGGAACGCGDTSCCGTCGVVANYAPSCGCSTCGDSCCGYGGMVSYDNYGCSSCSSGACSSGDCASGACGSTIVNSVPSNVEPTPVRPRNNSEDAQPTFDRDSGDSDLNNRTRPTDGFGPNNNRDSTPAESLPEDFSSPMRTNPGMPSTPATPSPGDFDFDPNPAPGGGGSGTIEQFRPAPAEGTDSLPPDDSASLQLHRTLKLSTIESDLDLVHIERRRTQVRARYRMPQMVARSIELEKSFTGTETQVATAE